MGTSSYKVNAPNLASHNPPLNQYQLLSSGPNFYLWHNPILRSSLIEFTFNMSSQPMLKEHIQSYFWRHRHYVFVSTMYFRQEEQADRYSIFYQRVFTNLSRIKDLCFQDALQFYYAGLKGFQLLYQKFGYFEVLQEMFHVTLDSKIKIWCDKNISRIYPATLGKGSQQAMVKKIINIIDSNIDHSKQIVSIGPILSKEASRTFDQAIEKLRQICKKNNLFIQSKLKCLQTIYQGKVDKYVDQFRFSHDAKMQQYTASVPESTITKQQSRKSQPKNSQMSSLKQINKINSVSVSEATRTQSQARFAIATPHTQSISHIAPLTPKQPICLNNKNTIQIINKLFPEQHFNCYQQLIKQPSRNIVYMPHNIIKLEPMRSNSLSVNKNNSVTLNKPKINFSYQQRHPPNLNNNQQTQLRSRSVDVWRPNLRLVNFVSPNPQSQNIKLKTLKLVNFKQISSNQKNEQYKNKTPNLIKQCQSTQYLSPLKSKIKQNHQVNKFEIKNNKLVSATPIYSFFDKLNQNQSRVQQKMKTSLQVYVKDEFIQKIETKKQEYPVPLIKISEPISLQKLSKNNLQNKLLFSEQRLNQLVTSFKQQKLIIENNYKFKTQDHFQNVFKKSQTTSSTIESTKFIFNKPPSASKNQESSYSTDNLLGLQDKKYDGIARKKYTPQIDDDIWNDLLKMKKSLKFQRNK